MIDKAYKNKDAIQEQLTFCVSLMKRLEIDIRTGKAAYWGGGMENRTARQKDIVRLRRELSILSKLLDPYGGES